MIKARVDNKLLVVLEPSNIDKIKEGKPMNFEVPEGVTEILLGYTPDMVWVIMEAKKGRSLIDTLQESLKRKEIHDRECVPPEVRTDIKL